jgi:integrase
LANLSAVLGWAVRHGLIEVNPADQVPRPEPAMEEEVRVLTPEEAERLMRAIEASGQADVLAAVTLGLFAGMRQREVSVAAWEDIDLVAGEVVVPIGKTTGRVVAGRRSRRRRVIELEVAAREWLAAAAAAGSSSGLVRAGNFRKRWEGIRNSVFPKWPANVLRHCYATYHYAVFRDERLLQAQMGHDSRDVLHQHYRAVVRREAAERFWAIRPGRRLTDA